MKKLASLFVLVSILASEAGAQNSTTGKLNVFSTVGISKISNDYKPASANSVQTTTGLERVIASRSSIGATLSFDSYGYKKTGASFNLSGSMKATTLALFYRQKFGNNTWQPYLKAGGGTTWLSLPVVSTKQAVTVIEKEVENVWSVVAEAGIQIRVLPRYAILVAAENKWMAESGLVDQKALRATGFKIGLISSF